MQQLYSANFFSKQICLDQIAQGYVCCHFSFCCAPPKRVWLCLHCILQLRSCRQREPPHCPSLSFFRMKTFLHSSVSPALNHRKMLALRCTCSDMPTLYLYWRDTNSMCTPDTLAWSSWLCYC